MEPFPDYMGCKPCFLSPSRYALGFAFVRQHDAASSVSLLAVAGNPCAVSRRIALFVVYALDRVARRPFSHVLKKGHEGHPPFVAHGDSAPTVTLERFVCRSVTSPEDSTPRVIFGRVAHPMEFDFIAKAHRFSLGASTTRRTAGFQIVAPDGPGCSAGTAAKPVKSFSPAPPEAKHKPLTKGATHQIECVFG